MIIRPEDRRRNYFEVPSPHDVFISIIEGNATENAIARTVEDEKAIVCTGQRTLDSLGTVHSRLDFSDLFSFINQDKVLILPGEFRIPSSRARHDIVYDPNTYVSLDSSEVKNALDSGKTYPKGAIAVGHRKDYGWTPSAVFRAGFRVITDGIVGYRWRNTMDRTSCYVDPVRCTKGLELRMLQNIAWFKYILPDIKIRLESSGLNPNDRKNLEEKYELGVRRIHDLNLKELINIIDLKTTDTIESEGARTVTQSVMRVPSYNEDASERSGRDHYYVDIRNYPHNAVGDGQYLIWNVIPKCNCDDVTWRESRTNLRPGPAEHMFDKHVVAALLGHSKIAAAIEDENLPELPIFVPTLEGMRFYHQFRYGAVIYDPHGDETYRTLNDTEIAKIWMQYVKQTGYDHSFTNKMTAKNNVFHYVLQIER